MAGGANVGNAYITIIPSMQGSQDAIEKELAGVDSSNAGNSIGNKLGTGLLATVKGHIGGITTALAGIGLASFARDSVSAFTDLAGTTATLKRNIGGTTEEVSGMVGAMKMIGVDANSSSTALNIFSKKIAAVGDDAGKTAEMENLLGTSIKNADGSMKDLNQILPGVADTFKSMPDGPEKTALAMQLFGRSGASMIKYLNQGSEGIAELTEKAREMGFVLGDEDAAKFSQFKSATRDFSNAIEGAKVRLGGALLPAITGVTDALNTTFIPLLVKGIGVVTDFATGVGSGIDAEGFKQAIDGIGRALDDVFSGDGGNGAKSFGEAIGQAINGLIPIIQGAEPIVRVLGDALKFIADNAEIAVPALISLGIGFAAFKGASGAITGLSTLKDAIGNLKGADKAAKGVKDAGTAVSSAGTNASNGAKGFMQAGLGIAGIGAGIMMAGVGIMFIANAAIALSNAGTGAQVTMVAIAAGIVAIGIGAAIAGEAMTAGALGFIAFGGAVALIGIGIAVAAFGIAYLVQVISENSVQLNTIIMTVGMAVSMIISTVGSALSQVIGTVGGAISGCIESVGNSISQVVTAISDGIANVVTAIGDSISGVLDSVAGIFDSIGYAAINAGIGMNLFVQALWNLSGIDVFTLGIALGEAAFGLGELVAAGGGAGDLAWALGQMAFEMYACGAGASMLTGAASAMGGIISGACDGASASVTNLGNAFNNAANTISSAMNGAVNAVTNAINQIASQCGREFHIGNFSLGKLPHFRMEGNFNAETKEVPRISVDWYAKGGVFNQPAIVGVGEGNSAEAVLPLNDTTYRSIAEGINNNNGGNSAFDYVKFAQILAQQMQNVKVQMDSQATIGALVNGAQRKAAMNFA